jgi:3-hydroxyacyl-[acyl-carrier-protein] dehydratase
MQLINTFCTIEPLSAGETDFEYRVRFCADHFIYRAHFPGRPVTPGVCILQLCRELAEVHTQVRLTIVRAANIKFLAVIAPQSVVSIRGAITRHETGRYHCTAQVYDAQTVYAKLVFDCLPRAAAEK